MIRKVLIEEINIGKSIYNFYETIRELPYSFLLDTGLPIDGGRFSFMGADPFVVIHSKDGITTIERRYGKSGKEVVRDNPLDVVKSIMGDLPGIETEPHIPFLGGAVGFLGYDLGRQLEKIPEWATDDLNSPDILIGLYDVILAVDHLNGKKMIISTGHPEDESEKASQRATERAGWLQFLLEQEVPEEGAGSLKRPAKITANFNKQTYQENVKRAIEHILDGDIFQVNLSQRFEMESAIEGWQLFKDLKSISPAPFSAYLNFSDIEVICSSPERFLKVDHLNRIETCPIKGTRPRGTNVEEDEKYYQELADSQKDWAELTMIVDLERSDLGRVCETGSVKATFPYSIETFPTVFHLVATVEGQLPEDKGIFDLLKAAFPGGSITGAPKIKAMEIIDRLEPVRRGVYTGSLGYIGFDGRADLNIIIRTIVKIRDKYYFQVGGGITAKSNPEAEYYETLDKAKALLRALKFEGSIEDGPYVY